MFECNLVEFSLFQARLVPRACSRGMTTDWNRGNHLMRKAMVYIEGGAGSHQSCP
jgi:hypothetical protein